MRDYIILRTEKSAKPLYRLLEVRVSLRVPDISYMGRSRAESVFVDTCIRIQLRTDPEDATVAEPDPGPLRGDSTREPDDVSIAHHRVVTAVHDLPVVCEKEICITFHLCHGMVDIGDHRVPRHIRTRHDNRADE